jgi:hypothetical protein
MVYAIRKVDIARVDARWEKPGTCLVRLETPAVYTGMVFIGGVAIG